MFLPVPAPLRQRYRVLTMADQNKPAPSEPPDNGNPVLKLDAQQLLEFVAKQTSADRASFDRLLKWFGIAATGLIAIATYFGYQSKRDVEATAAAIREEAKTQIQAEVAKETNEQNIQKYINAAIEKKTEAQFQDAIAKAVAAQLETKERQKFLETAVQRQVDLWFTTHQQVLRIAAQRQVDILTEHLQNRERILQLGDAAVQMNKSGPALRELQKLAKTSPDVAVKNAAVAEIARVGGWWGINSYLGPSNQATLDEKGLKPPYPTCKLLALLHSASLKERVASIEFLEGRLEKGVPEALMHVMADDNSLEAVVRAARAFAITTGRYGQQEVFPDVDDLQKWWAKDGPSIEVRMKFQPASACN